MSNEAAVERLLAGVRERDDDAEALRFIIGWMGSFRESIAQELMANAGTRKNEWEAIAVRSAARVVRRGAP